MLSLQQLIIVLAVIQGYQYGMKGVEFNSLSSFQLTMVIMNLFAEIMAQVFIAYKFPILFILCIFIRESDIKMLVNWLIKCTKRTKIIKKE